MLGNSITIEVQQIDILQLDSSSLAEQLTLIDHDLFKGNLSIFYLINGYLAFQKPILFTYFYLLPFDSHSYTLAAAITAKELLQKNFDNPRESPNFSAMVNKFNEVMKRLFICFHLSGLDCIHLFLLFVLFSFRS